MAELTISDMPAEILRHIFHFCRRQDLVNLLSVKVEPSCILGELSYLTNLYLSNTKNVEDYDLKSICLSTMQLETLSLKWCKGLGKMACLYISNQTSLRKLDLSGVKTEGFYHLGKLENLKDLNLLYTGVDDFDLKTICSSAMQLDTLSLSWCKGLGKMSCASISNQTSLRKLELNSVKTEGYHHLAKLKNLKDLDLSCSLINDFDLETICTTSMELESLSLRYCYGLGKMACVYITNQTSLRKLELSSLKSEGYHHLGKLINLKELDLSVTEVKDFDLEAICSSTMKLNILILEDCFRLEKMASQHIANQTSLTKLDLHSVEIKVYHHLEKLKNLKELDLSETDVKDADLRIIFTSRMQLDTLKLDRCKDIGHKACSCVANQTSLRELSLKEVDIEEGFHHLGKLENLKDLDLSETFVTDSDLETICSSAMKLDTLVLNRCQHIGKMACSYIAKQTSLIELSLEGAWAEGFHHIRKLGNLKDLNLSETVIDDSDLKTIVFSAMKLDSLTLIRCRNIRQYSYIAQQSSLKTLGLSSENELSSAYCNLGELDKLDDLHILFGKDR